MIRIICDFRYIRSNFFFDVGKQILCSCPYVTNNVPGGDCNETNDNSLTFGNCKETENHLILRLLPCNFSCSWGGGILGC